MGLGATSFVRNVPAHGREVGQGDLEGSFPTKLLYDPMITAQCKTHQLVDAHCCLVQLLLVFRGVTAHPHL